MDKKQLRLYKEESLPTSPIADSIYAIKSPTATSVVLYVIDSNGVAFPLRDLTSGGSGITTLVSGDSSISISGTPTSKNIQISQSLLDLINSAIQSGANISEFVNDEGYLTSFTETDPVFQASEASNFVTGDKANLDNQSGINTGDETTSSIQTKRPLKTINGETLEGSGDIVITGAGITNTSELTNDGSDGTSTYVETDELGMVAFSNDYNDLDNIPSTFTPSTHTHVEADITDLDKYSQSETDDLLNLKVPYTGATTNVDLGEHQLKAGQIELDQTPTGTFGVGKIRWNDSAGTAEIRLKGNNVTLQIGQELVKRVVNKTATNITLQEANYQVVKITGAQGQRLKVDLALADSDANSATTIGIVTETILNNEEGFITYSGEVNGINTTGSLQSETWNDGDILYLSPTTPGTLTNVKPTAPNHTVIIGYVEYAHITQGKIFVKVDNGYELEELHNVKIDSITNEDLLQYEASSNTWKNKQLDFSIIYPKVKGKLDFEELVNNQLSYFIPSSGVATFTNVMRVPIITLSGNTASFDNIANIIFSTTSVAGTLAFQRSAVFNIPLVQNTSDFIFKRKFKLNSNVTDSRFFCGISNMYGVSSPTNIDPSTMINSIGVCKLSSSQNLHLLYNDATGTATTVDLGVDYPANNIVDYWYTIEISKIAGSSNIIVTLKRTDVNGVSISTSQIVSTNYNTLINHYPTIWITNNATPSIASYRDYGTVLTQKNLW